jgi:hypothetical protein
MIRSFGMGILLLGLVAVLAAQPTPPSRWTRITGRDSTEAALSIAQTSDNGYIVSGISLSVSAGGTDIYLVKLDSTGRVVWTRTYGAASHFENAPVIRVMADGKFLLAGASGSYEGQEGPASRYLIKMSSAGITEWTRSGGTGRVLDLQILSDGNFIATGPGVMLWKTNSQGNSLWTHTTSRTVNDIGYSVQAVSDGFIIGGVTEMSHTDAYLIKTNAQGTAVWTRILGGAGFDTAFVVREAYDGGYYLAGSTTSNLDRQKPWLIKTNSQGIQSWSRHYGSTFARGTFYSMEILPDSDLIVSGVLDNHLYLARLDSAGNVRWDETYDATGSRTGAALSMQPTRDQGYVMAGYTYGTGAQGLDFYILKTGRDGMASPADPREAMVPTALSLLAYPNPFNPTTTLVFSLPQTARIRLDVFDITGRIAATLADEVWDAGRHTVSLHGDALTSGIYFARLMTPDAVATQKLMLLK